MAERNNRGGHRATRPLVLAVDDEELNLTVFRAALEPAGYEVWGATRASTARALIEVRTPDLLLLDVMMPGTSGTELCDEIRRNPDTADVPIVMVTALGAAESRSQALHRGADDYLEKPLDVDELIARVGSWLARGRTKRAQRRDDIGAGQRTFGPGPAAVRGAAALLAQPTEPLLRAMARAAGVAERDVLAEDEGGVLASPKR